MTLEELAEASPYAEPLAVPAWTLGCFRRRCITYANGREDSSTRVIWIQSHGLTGDIRVPAWRPTAHGRTTLDAFSDREKVQLAAVEGGVADTSWSGDRMRWNNWSALQPYDKWPEPGVLQRVGACLIEWAPSGVYVEDWRLQPGGNGLMVGLRLVSETEEGGVERSRGGGLVITGDHALFTLDRPEPLPSDRAGLEQVAENPSLLSSVLAARADYAVRGADGWRIDLSTDPFAAGSLLDLGAFDRDGQGHLIQTVGTVRRRWRIDTLLPDVQIPTTTPAAPVAEAWLMREGATLLATT